MSQIFLYLQKKTMRKLITIVFFQIGVNVIGIPEIFKHDISKTIIHKSIFHK